MTRNDARRKKKLTKEGPPAFFYPGHDLEALSGLTRYREWLLHPALPYLRGRVLELGAGSGDVSTMYLPQVSQAVLVEPDQALYQGLCSRFADQPQALPVLGTLEHQEYSAEAAQLQPSSFDAAVAVNVLEHIPDDVGALHALYRLLKPGGHLFLFVPALSWLFGSLDRLVQHQRRYHKAELARQLRASGFSIQRLVWFDALGVLPWLITGRILRSRQFNKRAADLFDLVGVPLGSLVESTIEPPLGKNLSCLAMKADTEPPHMIGR